MRDALSKLRIEPWRITDDVANMHKGLLNIQEKRLQFAKSQLESHINKPYFSYLKNIIVFNENSF